MKSRSPALPTACLALLAFAGPGRAALLPHLASGASYRNFTFNRETIGLDLPAFAEMDRVLGPVDDFTAKLQGKIDLVNVSAWRKMRASGARLAIHRKNLDMAEAFLALVQDQKAAGTATGLDVVRAQLQVNSARNAVLSAGSRADCAKYGLLALLGYREDRDIVLDDSLSQARIDFPLQEETLGGPGPGKPPGGEDGGEDHGGVRARLDLQPAARIPPAPEG